MTHPPLWIDELARQFWLMVGGEEPFPRRLVDPILWSPLDLAVEEIPALTMRTVRGQLVRRRLQIPGPSGEAALRGCLLASNGGGLILIDASDSPAERTFTLAHELAHFLRDYWQPRRRAVASFGPTILDALDGRRTLHPEEHLHGLLREIPLGSHTHLMRRDRGWMPLTVARAEANADRLAMELLAPADEIARRWPDLTDGEVLAERLADEFGLPRRSADDYADHLFPQVEECPLLIRLRKSANSCRTFASTGEQETGGSCDEQPT